jgi:tetratricopeptide (TPR) repeat protein
MALRRDVIRGLSHQTELIHFCKYWIALERFSPGGLGRTRGPGPLAGWIERQTLCYKAVVGIIDLVFGDRSEKKRALLERARAHLREGRVEKALQAAQRALKLDPESAEVRETMGRMEVRLARLAWSDGDLQDALELFGHATRLLADPVVLFHRGLAFRDAKQHLRAIEDFSRVMRSEELQAVPYATYALFCRGLCYREMGELKHAAKDFTACLEADPDSPLRHRYLVYRALTRSALGNRAEALADLRAAVEAAPRSSEVAMAMAALAPLPSNPARQLPAPSPEPPANPPGETPSPPAARAEIFDFPEVDWGDLPLEEMTELQESPAAETWLDAPARGEPEPAPPLPQGERLAALKAKRDAAFAERAWLFSRQGKEPQEVEACALPSPSQALAPEAGPAPCGRSSAVSTVALTSAEAAMAPQRPATDERTERFVRKLQDLLARFEEDPQAFGDLEFCVDYLLVVARMRELSPEEKRCAARLLGESTLCRLEAVEKRARERLLSMPAAASARALGVEMAAAVREYLSPRRAAGTMAEPALRSLVERFESLSRPEKYLALDSCGPRRFQQFTDYLVAFGGKEASP